MQHSQHELNFYGVTLITYVRNGFVFLHERSVAELFGVDNDAEHMEPFAPVTHNGDITLNALEDRIVQMIEHTLGNTKQEYHASRSAYFDLIKAELVDTVVKQLTFQYQALPLINMGDAISTSGIIDCHMPFENSQGYFIPRSVQQLSQTGQPVRLPVDVPYRHLIVRDKVWSPNEPLGTKSYVVEKVIELRYLGYVLEHNTTTVTMDELSKKTASPLRSSRPSWVSKTEPQSVIDFRK